MDEGIAGLEGRSIVSRKLLAIVIKRVTSYLPQILADFYTQIQNVSGQVVDTLSSHSAVFETLDVTLGKLANDTAAAVISLSELATNLSALATAYSSLVSNSSFVVTVGDLEETYSKSTHTEAILFPRPVPILQNAAFLSTQAQMYNQSLVDLNTNINMIHFGIPPLDLNDTLQQLDILIKKLVLSDYFARIIENEFKQAYESATLPANFSTEAQTILANDKENFGLFMQDFNASIAPLWKEYVEDVEHSR
jgi:hypothetical protein